MARRLATSATKYVKSPSIARHAAFLVVAELEDVGEPSR